MRISRIGGALGAELHDVDLSADLSEGAIAEIRQALLDHLVIFFRNQDLPPERFLAAARRFGRPIEYPRQGNRRLPRDHQCGEAGKRKDQLRRRVAFGHHLPAGTTDGDAAGGARSAGGRR